MKGRWKRLGCVALCLLWACMPMAAVAESERMATSDVAAQEPDNRRIESGERPEYVTRLLEIAQEELGYREGERSYTKYGEWAGDANAEWCAEFVCWCVNQVDVRFGTSLLNQVYPNWGGQNTGRDWFIAKGRFVYRRGNCPDWGYQWLWGETSLMKKNDYIPRPGDLVFFSYNEAGDTEHVALVEYCSLDAENRVVIHVIEGNNPSSVQRNRYYLNSSQVLGFGVYEDVVGTTMRGGNRGDKVLWLQESLHELGFLERQHLTGAYGGNTKEAVAAFQRQMDGKTVTGIADMQTQMEIVQRIAEKEFNATETWLVEE